MQASSVKAFPAPPPQSSEATSAQPLNPQADAPASEAAAAPPVERASMVPTGRTVPSPGFLRLQHWGLHPFFWCDMRMLGIHIANLASLDLLKDTHILYDQHPISKVEVAGTVVEVKLVYPKSAAVMIVEGVAGSVMADREGAAAGMLSMLREGRGKALGGRGDAAAAAASFSASLPPPVYAAAGPLEPEKLYFQLDDGSGYLIQCCLYLRNKDGSRTLSHVPVTGEAVVVTGKLATMWRLGSIAGVTETGTIREVQVRRVRAVSCEDELPAHILSTLRLHCESYSRPLHEVMTCLPGLKGSRFCPPLPHEARVLQEALGKQRQGEGSGVVSIGEGGALPSSPSAAAAASSTAASSTSSAASAVAAVLRAGLASARTSAAMEPGGTALQRGRGKGKGMASKIEWHMQQRLGSSSVSSAGYGAGRRHSSSPDSEEEEEEEERDREEERDSLLLLEQEQEEEQEGIATEDEAVSSGGMHAELVDSQATVVEEDGTLAPPIAAAAAAPAAPAAAQLQEEGKEEGNTADAVGGHVEGDAKLAAEEEEEQEAEEEEEEEEDSSPEEEDGLNLLLAWRKRQRALSGQPVAPPLITAPAIAAPAIAAPNNVLMEEVKKELKEELKEEQGEEGSDSDSSSSGIIFLD